MEAWAPQLKYLAARRVNRKFYLGDHLVGLGSPAKMVGSPNPRKLSLKHNLAPCSYWISDTLRAIVECGSAFIEDISKGMQMLANYSVLLTYMVVVLM